MESKIAARPTATRATAPTATTISMSVKARRPALAAPVLFWLRAFMPCAPQTRPSTPDREDLNACRNLRMLYTPQVVEHREFPGRDVALDGRVHDPHPERIRMTREHAARLRETVGAIRGSDGQHVGHRVHHAGAVDKLQPH